MTLHGRLDGTVAIVTGAGQGIGRGTAIALAKEGARVAVVGRTEHKVVQVAEEIAALGGVAEPLVCDVGHRDQVDAMVEATVERLGTVRALVNNAQDFVFKPLEEITEADLEITLSSGLMGSFNCMQACLPHLKVGGGSVVNMATSAGLTGEKTFGAYAMAKEAVRALTKVAATEWGPYGITVNAVCPSAISPAFEAFAEREPEVAARMAADRPLGRMGDAELDIGRAVVSLVSDDMRYLTGGTLMLTGGRVLLG